MGFTDKIREMPAMLTITWNIQMKKKQTKNMHLLSNN